MAAYCVLQHWVVFVQVLPDNCLAVLRPAECSRLVCPPAPAGRLRL